MSGSSGDLVGVVDDRYGKRRARTERRVLDATRQLLAEAGFTRLTIEGVATLSGVAKTSIYRRYRSRTDLTLAVLLDMVDDVSTQPYVADTRTELVRLVDRTVELLTTGLLGPVMRGLVSEMATDPEVVRVYREQVVTRRLAELVDLVERGVSRGELRPGLNPSLVNDLLLGPVYHRFFLSGGPMDEDFGERLVDAVYPVLAVHR